MSKHSLNPATLSAIADSSVEMPDPSSTTNSRTRSNTADADPEVAKIGAAAAGQSDQGRHLPQCLHG